MKTKAGIITIVDLTNYGNRLQNYAVSETLRKMQIDSETLYVVKGGKSAKKKVILMQFLKNVPFVLDLKIFLFGNKSAKHLRYLNFDKFTHSNMKMKILGESDDVLKECSKFDCFVIGSDQIWNPEYGYADDFSFAMFAEPKQRICFSPSFGVQSINVSEKEKIGKRLKDIPYISVREESGSEIVEELTGKKATVLIDPTMMLDAEDWMKVCKSPKKVNVNKKYILSYFLGQRTKEQLQKIERMKEKYGLEEYILLDKNSPDLYATGPSEFLELIRNAEMVCTDSFHASVFSILFQRPFLVFKRDGNGAGISSRLDTLLGTFKLTDRQEGKIKEEDLFVCDYKETFEILKKERERVYSFLKQSMDIK